MSDRDPQLEIARLRDENERLRRQAVDAQHAIQALARGEVDAVSLDASATPILLRAAQEQLRRSEQLWRGVFDGALDAIVLSEDDGKCIDGNRAACELFGLSHEQLLTHNLRGLARSGDDFEAWFRAFRELGHMRGSFRLKHAEGPERTLDYASVASVAPGVNLSVFRDITDRIAAEDALRRSEAQFRVMIEKSAEVISLTAPDGTRRYITPSAWKLLGWAPDELHPGSLWGQVAAEDLERVKGEVARLVRTRGRDVSMDFRVHHRDGSLLWIESTITNLLDDPDVAALVGNYRDVTARKLSAEALVASRNALEQAQAIAHVGSFTSGIRPQDQIDWSRECCRIFGVPEGTTLTVESLFDRVHPEDRETLRLAERNALEHDVPLDVKHRVQRPDNRLCWVRVRASVDGATVAGPPRITGTVQDITDQHVGLEALRASEERYRRIVETTAEGVIVYDANNVITFANGQLAKMLRCAVEEVIGQSLFTFVHEVDRTDTEQRIVRRRRGVAERSDFRFRRKDGNDLWTSTHSTVLFDREGCFEGVIGMLTDISEQRLSNELQARLAAIVESSEDAIISENLDGVVTSWNSGAERLYQYSAAEMVGRSLSVLIPSALQREQRTHARRGRAPKSPPVRDEASQKGRLDGRGGS